MTFVLSTTRIALFCTLLSVILTGGHLAADKVSYSTLLKFIKSISVNEEN